MTLHLALLSGVSIFEQLQLEEALLRSDDRNWCLLNTHAPRAIVMGVSGKKEELVDLEKARLADIPLIRRFSGGGTVIVDPDTVFATLIFNKEAVDFPSFPEQILRWSALFYKEAFQISEFDLKENDYVIGELKCAGNAQYLRKDRFLHHTTFLWDFQEENMNFLLHPKKEPLYRKKRTHLDFLCKLRPFLPRKESLFHLVEETLKKRYSVKTASLEELQEIAKREHRKTTESVVF